MAKMTKAQARRRLNEASVKIGKVFQSYLNGEVNISPNDMNKLVSSMHEIRKIASKLK